MISSKLMKHLYGYDDYNFMVMDCIENEEWVPSLLDVSKKCREWAYEYGYEITVYKLQDTIGKSYRCIYAHNNLRLNKDLRHGFYAETEEEAVFLACEQIRLKVD